MGCQINPKKKDTIASVIERFLWDLYWSSSSSSSFNPPLQCSFSIIITAPALNCGCCDREQINTLCTVCSACALCISPWCERVRACVRVCKKATIETTGQWTLTQIVFRLITRNAAAAAARIESIEENRLRPFADSWLEITSADLIGLHVTHCGLNGLWIQLAQYLASSSWYFSSMKGTRAHTHRRCVLSLY